MGFFSVIDKEGFVFVGVVFGGEYLWVFVVVIGNFNKINVYF